MLFRTGQRACPTCGAPAKGGLFCRMCGSRLDEEDPAPSFRLAGVRDRARFALMLVQTWSGARRRLAAIEAELRRLSGERQQLLLDLGDATYRADEEEGALVRDRIRELDDRIEQEHEKQRRVVEEASRNIDREHQFVAPTQVVDSPADPESAPDPPKDTT